MTDKPSPSRSSGGHFAKGYTPWNKRPTGAEPRVTFSCKLKKDTADKIRRLRPQYHSQGHIVDDGVARLPE